MKTSEQIDTLAAAMVKAQAALKPAIKDSLNPAFKSKYADLTAVWDACREPLTVNAIAVWQDVTLNDEGVSVVTRLVHASGQWVEFGPLTVPLSKRDAHGVGSATSYGKRYGLSAAVGIVSDDDDGNAAVEAREPARVALPPKPEGYDAWLTSLKLAAQTGVDTLGRAYGASEPQFRKYLAATDPGLKDELKGTAKAVEDQIPF